MLKVRHRWSRGTKTKFSSAVISTLTVGLSRSVHIERTVLAMNDQAQVRLLERGSWTKITNPDVAFINFIK